MGISFVMVVFSLFLVDFAFSASMSNGGDDTMEDTHLLNAIQRATRMWQLLTGRFRRDGGTDNDSSDKHRRIRSQGWLWCPPYCGYDTRKQETQITTANPDSNNLKN